MAIVDSYNYTLYDVINEINPTTLDLIACFNSANVNYFDSTYYNDGNDLKEFRNYGAHNAPTSSTSVEISPTYYYANYGSTSFSLSINTSAEWFLSETTLWISSSQTTGTGSTTVTISLTENTGSSNRSAIITVDIDGDSATCEVEQGWNDGSGTGGCFIEGTQITMADNTYKNIEDIEIGDYVLSHYNDKNVASKVNELLIHTPENTNVWYDGYYEIITLDNNKVYVTGNHPVYTFENNKWIYKNVEELKVNDYLMLVDNKTTKITNKTFIKKSIDVVYNLSLNNPKNYFANGINVHNDKVDPTPEPD